MNRLYLRLAMCGASACLLLVGCATKSSQLSPSLLSQLKGGNNSVQQANYQVEPEEELGTKKIKDPLSLKLRFAQCMEELENYPEARIQYATVLAEKPENFEAIVGLARIDQIIGQPEQAEAGFRRALALRPDSPAAKHGLGQFYLEQGRIAEAIPLLNKALLEQPNERAYRYDLAVALAKSGDINAALPHFKRTVGEAAAYHNVATILRDAGDLKAAEQYYRQALSIQDDLEESRHALAALYHQRQSQHFAGPASGGSVIQGTPNQSIVPAAHQAATSVRGPAQSSTSLTPAQQEQRRNQQSLIR